MRELNVGEYVKINDPKDCKDFLEYLEKNTDIRWGEGSGLSPTEYNPLTGLIVPFTLFRDVDGLNLEKTGEKYGNPTHKEVPLSDFIEPNKPEPTWAMFWDNGSQVKCKSVFLTELEGAVEPFISVHKDDIDKHLHGKKFKTAKWGNMILLSNEVGLKAEILAKIEVMDLDELINLREKL